MIRVRKRDGSVETFDTRKLAGALWRVMGPRGGRYRDAWDLACAIRIFLSRKAPRTISSAAVFEMCLCVLRRIRMPDAAGDLERRRFERTRARARLAVRAGEQGVAAPAKQALAEWAMERWRLRRRTARLLAGGVEQELCADASAELGPRAVRRRLAAAVAQSGLAETATETVKP
jgi:hypothetical protein